MSRNKRKTTALQAIAVTTVCLLFVTTALVGLYKCFSQEPAPKDAAPAQGPDGSSPQEPLDAVSASRAGVDLSAHARKDHFYTILLGGLDDENGGSDTNLLVALDAQNGTIIVVSLPRDTLLNVSWSV